MESRAQPIAKATVVEEKVRSLYRRAGSKLHDKLMERADVQQVVTFLASDAYDIRDRGLELVRRPAGQFSGDAYRLLAGLLLLSPPKARKERFERNTRRRKNAPIDGWHTDFIDDPSAPTRNPSGAKARRRRTTEECTCPQPQLVAKLSRAEYPAESAEQMDPAAALYTAECRTCGGPYMRPGAGWCSPKAWSRRRQTGAGPSRPGDESG